MYPFVRRSLHLVVLLASLSLASLVAAEALGAVDLRGRTHTRGHADSHAASAHWTLDPIRAERTFERGRMRVLSAAYAGRGLTGAQRVELALLDARRTIAAKWKPSPRRLDAFNNSPRREIAAYELQKLFLEPEEYVVPTSRLRCLRPSEFAGRKRIREVTLRGTNCRIGVLSVWLEEVEDAGRLLDADRFAHDAAYARRLADFNLATYLMRHGDARRGNFLVAREDMPPRFFSVDNGIAFSGFLRNWFVPSWQKVRVPALSAASVERLRQVRLADLARLGVVAQLEWRSREHVINVPPSANLDPEEGVRIEGRTIQLGLDQKEIETLWQRIEHLLDEVDQGEIAVF